MTYTSCLVVMGCLSVHVAVCSVGRIPLHVGGLFELTEHWWIRYTNFFPDIIEYAFEGIRNQSDILADYELKLVTKDTQGANGLAAKRLVELVEEQPPKVAVIGPSLSDELTLTGQMAPFYNVIELSYVATTASTVDRSLFPTLFKVNQITDDLNPVRIKMMEYFGWSRVATMFYQSDKYVSQMNLFHEMIQKNNMTLLTSAVVSETNDLKSVFARFKANDVRIIMGAFRSNIAPSIFCEAYHQGMYGDSYVWILMGTSMYPNWIASYADPATMGCTLEQLIKASRGHFTLNSVRTSLDDDVTISGERPSEVLAELKSRAKATPYTLSSYAGLIYDTAWSLAIGLNNSLPYLDEAGLKLEHFNYSDAYRDAISKGMHDVIFTGVSGPVAFDEAGGRIGVTLIEYNYNGTRTSVGMYSHLQGEIKLLVPLHQLWTGGLVPEDRFTYQTFPARSSKGAMVLVITFNVLGCMLAIMFLTINIYHRNQSYIKMSSPMLNNVILGGCIMMYMVVFISAFDYDHNFNMSVSSSMCMVRAWLMCLGFTSLFGALFSKTYRIYVLFRNYELKRKAIQDYHLFGVVGVLLLLDCLILVPWTLLHGLQKETFVRNTKDLSNNNRIVSEVYSYCKGSHQVYWFASMYVYKGLLLAFGTFLAWETRHVTVAMLNDSKYIGACIYNVVTVCIFGVPMAHVLPLEQTTLTFILESCLLIFSTTICQCILFIPKLHNRKKVHGRFLHSPSTTTPFPDSGTVPSTLQPYSNGSTMTTPFKEKEEENKKYKALMEENEKLRQQVAAEAIDIAKLRKAVLEATGNVHFYKSGPEYVVFTRGQNDTDNMDNADTNNILEPDTEYA